MNKKHCPFCGSPIIKKNGHKRGYQMYKCNVCGSQFEGVHRIDKSELYQQYVSGKKTHQELALEHNCSARSVQRWLSQISMSYTPSKPLESVIIMDTTYFGRTFGVMLFQDAETGCVLLRKYVKYETNQLYMDGLAEIRSHGTSINGVVCDGHKGLLQSIENIPAQMCQFHMIQIIRRLLTNSPHLQAGIELLELVRKLTRVNGEAFSEQFGNWCKEWDPFLKERTILSTGKSTYTHRRLRAARNSLRYHLPWLFTYQIVPKLKIPNTTNKLEGTNSELKRRLHSHNGLTQANKKKFIDGFLKTWGKPSE